MKVFVSIPKLRTEMRRLRQKGQRIGFVPTMGALHDGHLSLIRRSCKENTVTVVSIFVNPLQFGPQEDLAAYPRTRRQDHALADAAGCDIVFCPSIQTMYPDAPLTAVEVERISRCLCGSSRPGHFTGVATVVAKLFNILEPDVAYFGQKDYQQAAVIRRMTRDLNFNVRIKLLPTVREQDGLAMSSRNRYLSAGQRAAAPVLFQALMLARRKIKEGEVDPDVIKALIRRAIRREKEARFDYVGCVDAETLEPVRRLEGKCVIAVAAFFGKARLIDNIVLQI